MWNYKEEGFAATSDIIYTYMALTKVRTYSRKLSKIFFLRSSFDTMTKLAPLNPFKSLFSIKILYEKMVYLFTVLNKMLYETLSAPLSSSVYLKAPHYIQRKYFFNSPV